LRLLLDTHAVIWWSLSDSRLSAIAASALAAPENDVFVSAASAWEITTKYRIGKLPGVGELAADVAGFLDRENFGALPVTVRHAERAGRLEGLHKDPFDRMLIAQALIENLTLISNETVFDRFGVLRLW
jgi:PIN domain nuclease of toxin-antitoxin system